MLNLIKSELYKMLHRRCTMVFFLVFVVGGFFMNFVLRYMIAEDAPGACGEVAMSFWTETVCMISWFLVYMIAQMVHSNESKIGVLKNSVSFGFGRSKLYVARYITQLITLVVSVVLIVASVLLGNQIFNGGCSGKILEDFLRIVAVDGILWIGALSLAHALAMCLNSNTLATVIYILYFLMANSFIRQAYTHFPDNHIVSFLYKYEMFQFSENCVIDNSIMKNLWLYFVIGGVYLVVSFVIGILVYQRKEVK